MNEPVVDWCRSQALEVTRSSTQRQNDQAWVEQKNGAVLRRLVGYGRSAGVAAARALGRLDAAARLHVDVFQPSRAEDQDAQRRPGDETLSPAGRPAGPGADPCSGRRHRRSDVARAPRPGRSRRAPRRDSGGPGRARRAGRPQGNRTRPAAICPRRNLPPPQSAIVDLDHFAASLETTRRDGERRAPHRRPYRRRKPVSRRPCMLDDVQDRIRAWLDREPTVAAIEVPSRLGSAQPERFSDKHLRTVQRAVKVWRSQQARRIILAGSFRRATPA